MAYSDFDLRKAEEQFHLTHRAKSNLYAATQPVPVDEAWLSDLLNLWIPVGVSSGTEKARSEFIVAPILMQLKRRISGKLNIFSGSSFDVDINQGLDGVCDFILTCSSEKYYVRRPILTMFEAKNANIHLGLGPCVAAMVAARKWNLAESSDSIPIYGVVTTGELWKFLKLEGQTVWIDSVNHYVTDLGKILAIFLEILTPYTNPNKSPQG